MRSDKSPALISVVIAVYNCKATLQQCLDSVTQQSHGRIELIVIDGGSTDGTVDLIRANSQQISYWISEPDRGIYNAWNKALARAKGDWVCFLGADDYLWDPQVLARIAEQLALVQPSILIAYGQIMLLDHHDQALFTLGNPWHISKKRFKQEMCIPHPAVMHRRSFFDKNGLFDEAYRIAGDYALLLRELKDGTAVFFPGIVVAAMRHGGISSSPENTLNILRETRLAQKAVGIFWPSRVWMMAVARIYVRVVLWHLLGEKRARKWLDSGRRMMGLPAYWTRTWPR